MAELAKGTPVVYGCGREGGFRKGIITATPAIAAYHLNINDSGMEPLLSSHPARASPVDEQNGLQRGGGGGRGGGMRDARCAEDKIFRRPERLTARVVSLERSCE